MFGEKGVKAIFDVSKVKICFTTELVIQSYEPSVEEKNY